MLSRRKKLKVEWTEFRDKKEHLSIFLRKFANEEVTSDEHNLLLDSEKLSIQELRRLVNKFIYHQHLSNEYWVSLEGDTVKIHEFEQKKTSKHKKRVTPPSTIKHGW